MKITITTQGARVDKPNVYIKEIDNDKVAMQKEDGSKIRVGELTGDLLQQYAQKIIDDSPWKSGILDYKIER